ncbi:MAG: hypothetical protein KAH18_09770 [Psychromonas sp.]|nr:hypothetical protein [Psychromonas sp.]
MGFTTFGLGEGDQLDIRILQAEILNTLHHAREAVRRDQRENGTCVNVSIWFSASRRRWRREMVMKLSQMLTLINVETIKLNTCPYMTPEGTTSVLEPLYRWGAI